MPTLDICINDIFEDGNIPADSGETPVPVIAGTLLDPDDYDPDAIEYSLNHTRFYNSMYLALMLM